MNVLFPLYWKLSQKPVLVAGGGPVAQRRVEALLACGAQVTVVSPELVPALEALSSTGGIRWEKRPFTPEDLRGASFAFFATGDRDLARQAREEAARLGIPFHAAEDETLGDFQVPAVLTRGDVKVAVSTGGLSPSGAARFRDAIAAWLAAGEPAAADAAARGRDPAARGKVYIVGAGPGDPGLLTVRALSLLAAADVVYHDRLVSDAILDAIPPRVEKVYVGKEVGSARQAEIIQLLAGSARRGKTVVRLKGGDPMVFGRGGEEVLGLREEGIDFEVVPGVSALSSVPAAAGIPVTFRGLASEIVVRSGHASGEAAEDPDTSGQPDRGLKTHVYFMAASRLPELAEELLAEGLSPATPVAVVQKGTLPDQKVLIATLDTLAEVAGRERIETPALVIAGEVVLLSSFSSAPAASLQPPTWKTTTSL